MGSGVDQVSIVGFNDEGQLLFGPESVPLASVAERAQGLQVTVLLPAREIVTTVASVPAASPARLRQMLPFSLEDDFAGDVEALHFAAGERNEADLLAVSVIDKERLGFWRSVLRSTGIDARRICSEADGVPDTPGVVTLYLEGRKVLGRRPGGAAFAFEELTLTELWQLLAAERENKDDLDDVVLFVDPATKDERRAEIDAWRGSVANLEFRELGDGCLPRLAAGLVHDPGTNLLQGEFALRSNYAALVRPWRAAAGLLLALVGVAVLGKGALYFKLSAEDTRLTEQIAEVCRQSYSSPEPASCRLEMLRRLSGAGQSASGGAGGLLAALAAVAAAAGESQVFENMNYSAGITTLEVIVPSVQYLDAFTQGIASRSGFEVRTETTTAQPDGRYRSRLRVVGLER